MNWAHLMLIPSIYSLLLYANRLRHPGKVSSGQYIFEMITISVLWTVWVMIK